MSYFEDCIEGGSCCSICGEYLGDDVGYMQACASCASDSPEPSTPKKTKSQKRNALRKKAKQRAKTGQRMRASAAHKQASQ
jgi:hypothetical protein